MLHMQICMFLILFINKKANKMGLLTIQLKRQSKKKKPIV